MKLFFIKSYGSKKLRGLLLAAIILMGAKNILGAIAESGAEGLTRDQAELLETGKVDSVNVFDLIVKALQSTISLNYFTDSKVVFDFWGNKIGLDWESAGSGDIFKPLEPIKLDFNAAESRDGKISMTNVVTALALNGLMKGVGQDRTSGADEGKTQKKGGVAKLVKAFQAFRFTPLHNFCLKLVLLVKSINGRQDTSALLNEIVTLLFRLSLVDDSLFDKNKPLTSYLSESVNELIGGVDELVEFGLSDFINQIWSVIVGKHAAQGELLLDKPVIAQGFVFSDEILAKEAFEKFKSKAGSSFYDDFVAFGEESGKDGQPRFSVTDITEFDGIRGDVSVEDVLAKDVFAHRVVGYKESYFSNQATWTSSLEECILTQAKSLGDKEGVIFCEDKVKHQFWVIYVTRDVGILGTLKSTILTFVRVVKEYINIKKSIYEGQDMQSIQARAVTSAHQALQRDLRIFAASKYGKEIFENICKHVGAILSAAFADEEGKKAQLLRKEALKKETSENMALRSSLIIEREAYKQRLMRLDTKSAGSAYSDVVAEIGRLTKRINDLDAKITENKQTITRLDAEVDGSLATEDKSILEDKRALDEFTKIARDRVQANEPIDPAIASEIERLKQKIATAETQSKAKFKTQERLNMRNKVAQVFEEEADRIEASLGQEEAAISAIQNEHIKAVQELLFKERKVLAGKFIARLRAYAVEIRQTVKKAEKLQALRQAINAGELSQMSDVVKKEKDILEIEAGYILDSDSQENFIGGLMMAGGSILDEFAKDMINASESDTKMLALKKLISEAAQEIVGSSKAIQENMVAVKYIRQNIPSSIQALLRVMGVWA